MRKPKARPVEKEDEVKPRQAPGKTIEAREKQIISDAYDLAQRLIRAGTVSSQVHSHFLKIGSTQAQLELEKLRQENLLLEAKTEQLKSQKKVEELYAKAIIAMGVYSGQKVETIEEDE